MRDDSAERPRVGPAVNILRAVVVSGASIADSESKVRGDGQEPGRRCSSNDW